jgi:hypothetical protein
MRAAALIGALVTLPLVTGSGSADPKPPRQLLLAVPKLGTLTGNCKPGSAFRLTYTGERDRDVQVLVRIAAHLH